MSMTSAGVRASTAAEAVSEEELAVHALKWAADPI